MGEGFNLGGTGLSQTELGGSNLVWPETPLRAGKKHGEGLAEVRKVGGWGSRVPGTLSWPDGLEPQQKAS